jgi:hypothetical protein
MSTGLVKQREHMCQLAGALLRGSRNSGQGDEDISGFSTSMAKQFYRGVFEDVNYNFTKGIDD